MPTQTPTVDYERRQRTNALTPSETITSTSYRSMQGKEFPIYDGRHPEDQGIVSSTLAMPISLYHPIFAKYLHWMSDGSITPSPECIAATARLMSAASVLYPTENDRKHAIRGPLQVVLGNTIRTVCNPDKTEADGQTIIALNMNDSARAVPVLISEEKCEPGVDAATQASLSMLRTWCDFNLDDFRNLGCCPTFLIGLDGCHLVICGAVLTNKCIVNRLAMLWVGRSSTHDEGNTVNIARAFHALSLAIEELERWYKDIAQHRPIYTSQANDHPRFFPFPDRYPLNGEDFSAGTIQFKYLRPLEESSTCVTFLAQMQPNNRADKKHIVVKFVQSYSPELHQLLAEQRMAPDLLYCGRIDQNTPLGNWKLVVMEYFDGRPSYERELHTTEQVRRRVEDIVKFAHEHGFVLGDIRPPNVLVGERNDVRMIDFDWAGKAGEVRYPAHMSTALWTSGIEPTVLITKTHDNNMIQKWFPHGS
ncbi:hypothetical protein BJ138DRAFT_1012901 [Hygrophoropsis aurantiaca]|uniref:Uncharacterized protein n=1 Tax=Hygrophoropsis aurantiaca TaxID=72124 RepID=A0ACB8A5T2_9AGAM|nr:hypothetical protein BJ138DRAFT_1012901 [Hygrophoropsis aurantiaca]